MDAVQKLSETIDKSRSNLSPSQLKKLRKKRGKLLQQLADQQANAGLQPEGPAAKRLCLEASQAAEGTPEASTSLQLSSHGPGAAAAAAACRDQEVVSPPHSHAALRPHRQQRPQPAQQQQRQRQQRHGKDCTQLAGSSRPLLQVAVPTSSNSSAGPCRTDLSGQLVVIQQELHGSSNEDNSSSSFSQLLLHTPAQASSDCSLGTGQMHQPASHQHAPVVAAMAGNAAQQHGQQQEQQPQQQQQSRKRSRPSCQYGNYHHYYGYRLKPSGFEDPRLKVLDPAWFMGAEVLDVGCNEGLVTLALALHCGCRNVCGVDIDPVLVTKACTNLSRSRTQLNQQLHAAVRERNLLEMQPQHVQPQQQQQQQQPPAGPLGIIAASVMQAPPLRHSNTRSNGTSSSDTTAALGSTRPAVSRQSEQQQAQHQQQQQQVKPHKQQPPHVQPPQHEQGQQQQQLGPKARIVSIQRQIKALSRVSFRAGNWLDLPCPHNKYEVITCFSVTKWIQLNWGDDGIMKLFHKFYRCLAPGGLLVLEPQPFKSYKTALHKPGVQAAPYVDLEQLKLRPDQYADFLTQRVGFELVQQLGAVSEAAGAQAVSVKGFDRPILVLRKPVGRQAAQGAAAAGAAGTAAAGHAVN